MSITDELREYADRLSDEAARKSEHGFSPVAMALKGIADRIDAEHESACAEAYGNGVMSVPIALDESAWVELPKDAHGEYIHIGDVMDKGRVTCIRDCGKGWEVILDSLYTFDTSILHHHTPTVEDVLREFTDEVWNRCCEGATASDSGIDELVAECAAKLRLAGDAE